MSLPDDRLSLQAVPALFLGPRALPVQPLVDYEHGGIAIQDPSQGLRYQTWRCRAVEGQILISAPNTPEFMLYAAAGELTEISLAFDQNMHPVVSFVEAGIAKWSWYNSTVPAQVVDSLPAGCVTPRVALDDKRQSQTQVSDVILAYMREGRLYYRQQRDRYLVEIDPTEGLPEPQRAAQRKSIAESPGLIKIGMNRQQRFQFMLAYAGAG